VFVAGISRYLWLKRQSVIMIGCVHVFILVAGKLHAKKEWHNGLAIFFIELEEDWDVRATPPVLSM
jgi:hypothetical protein